MKRGHTVRIHKLLLVLVVLGLAAELSARAQAGEGNVTWYDSSCGFFVLSLPEGQPERFGLYSWRSGVIPKLDQVWEGDIVEGEEIEITNKATGEKMGVQHWANAKEQAQLTRNAPPQCASKWKRRR